MSKRVLSEEKLKQIKMQQSRGRGPGSRFGGVVEKPKNLKGTVSRLLKYLSSSKKALIIIFIGIFITCIASLSNNVVVQKIVDSLGVYNEETSTWEVLPEKEKFISFTILLASLYLLNSLTNYFVNYIASKLSVNMTKQIRNDLFAKIVKLPIRYTDTHPHGDIMSRMTNDVDNISNAITNSLTNIVDGLITIIGCLLIMIYYSPLLTLVSMVTLVMSLIITIVMSKTMRPLFTKQQTVLGILNSQAEEMISGCKTVIAYNYQNEAKKEFNEYSDDLCKTATKAQIVGGSMGPIMNFTGNVGHFLVSYFGSLFILLGIGNSLFGAPLTIGIVVTFITLNKQFNRPINTIASLYSTLITAMAGAERVFSILDEPTEEFEGKIPFDPKKTDGTIDFEHVNFSYNKGKQIINDFTLDVRKGHKIALVGATGSGKTTMVNLLLRFYDVDSGSIKVDGININDISKKDLRDAISIVLQDAVLFEDTVENNVKYGKDNATDEEFVNAITMAHCTSFINKLPDKEKTVLSEGANNISQGQRQLLTIARAILADPKILILDEATGSVDTRTEKKIQDAMINLMKNRTSIIIAHRLSTIQDADLIIVMDQGHIVEMGNHQELIALDGVYNKLYQTQYQGLNI